MIRGYAMKYLGTITDNNDIATKEYVDNAVASGGGSAVTGVKGNVETAYRTGQVNITPANLGAATAEHTHTLASLGLTDLFVVEKAVLDNVSITKTANFAETKEVPTVSGYTPIGVVGYAVSTASSSGANVTYIQVRAAYLTDERDLLVCNGRNNASSAAKVKLTWFVLYVKTTVV